MSYPPRLGLLLGHLRDRMRWRGLARSPQLLWLVGAVLGGAGAVAFAVAPLSVTTPLPPTRLVIEAVQAPHPAEPSAQLQAWRDQHLELHRTEPTRATDTVATVLHRLDVHDPAAVAALAGDENLRLALGRQGNLVHVRAQGDGDLQALTVRYPAADAAQALTHYQELSARRLQGRWAVQVQTLPLVAETRWASGRISTQLRAAAVEAQLPAAVVTQLLELCAERPDAECALGRGDSFAVLYESLSADGEAVPWNDGIGRVLAVRFVARGVARQYTWFAGADGKGGYFDARGRGRESGFRTSPVEFTQITSGFATRIDPFRRRPMAHQGIDYAAPVGTPVQSVAAGVVEFAGRQAGYGNVVEVRHASDRTTLYAHLSRIDVVQGERVPLGRVLGAVGATGWATGPHLHFEYRVAGVHQDPQLAAQSAAQSAEQLLLAPAARARLERSAQAARGVLDRALLLAAEPTRFE